MIIKKTIPRSLGVCSLLTKQNATARYRSCRSHFTCRLQPFDSVCVCVMCVCVRCYNVGMKIIERALHLNYYLFLPLNCLYLFVICLLYIRIANVVHPCRGSSSTHTHII